MPSIEITAKSEEEAAAQAAEKLGVAVGQLTITVLEKSKGLFGKASVRIKAETKAEAKAPAAKAAKVEKPAPERAPEKPAKAERPARKPKEAAAEASPAPEPAVEAPAKPERGRRGAKPKAEEAAAPAAEERDERNDYVATDADAKEVLALVQTLLSSADLEVETKIGSVQGRYVTVQLDGKDAAHLVGKHGEVLNAMQYLVNIIGARKFSGPVRVTLDGNDYRRRREDALTKLATRIAEQVLDRQEEAVLDALPAFERRIVHKAISEIDGVTTYSEGEEPNRRVVIAPAE